MGINPVAGTPDFLDSRLAPPPERRIDRRLVAAIGVAALLVLGSDPGRFKPRFFQRVVRKIRRRASCLIWIAGEGP